MKFFQVVAATATLLVFLFASELARAEEEAPSPPASAKFGASVSGGVTYRPLFRLPVWSADAGVALGADLKPGIGLYARANYDYGHTPAGLAVHAATFGASVEAILGRFRLGLEPNFTHIGFLRSTTRTTVTGNGVGISPLVGFDFFPFDGHALFALARVDWETIAPHWGGNLSIGVRY